MEGEDRGEGCGLEFLPRSWSFNERNPRGGEEKDSYKHK